MRSLGIQILLGFSLVELGFSGVPRFRVQGANTTRCLSVMLPLAIFSGSKSFESALEEAILVNRGPKWRVGVYACACVSSLGSVRVIRGEPCRYIWLQLDIKR